MGSQAETQGSERELVTVAACERQQERERRRSEVTRRYDFGVIRTLRTQMGYSIERFAEICGVSYAPISRIESNLIKPNLETLDRIAEGLCVTTHDLLMMASKQGTTIRQMEHHRVGSVDVESLKLSGLQCHQFQLDAGETFSSGDLHARGEVTLLVQSGKAVLQLGDKTHEMSAGSAASYDSDMMDTLRASRPARCVLLVKPRVAAGR